MKTITILFLFIFLSLEGYSQWDINVIHDTIIKDDYFSHSIVTNIDSSTFTETSHITCEVYVSCHIYPETYIQGYFHALIVPYIPKDILKPTEIVIWGHRILIKNGYKYMKL